MKAILRHQEAIDARTVELREDGGWQVVEHEDVKEVAMFDGEVVALFSTHKNNGAVQCSMNYNQSLPEPCTSKASF